MSLQWPWVGFTLFLLQLCAANIIIEPVPTNLSGTEGFFSKYVNIFNGISIVATTNVSNNKIIHSASILYQYLDNDGDGQIDDINVSNSMINNLATLAIFYTEDEAEKFFEDKPWKDSIYYWWQPLFDEEIIIDSCCYDIPFHNKTDCNPRYDATLEEILHFVTHSGVSAVYDSVWGERSNSTIGKLIFELNGNCGWGYTNNYINPSSGNCSGVYAYRDVTCEENCIVAEGIYWTLTSILQSQNYEQRALGIADEWLMSYPSGNYCVPTPFCQIFDQYAPDLYNTFTSYEEWTWLPSKLPNGKYQFQSQKDNKIDSVIIIIVICIAVVVMVCVGVFLFWRFKRKQRKGTTQSAKPYTQLMPK